MKPFNFKFDIFLCLGACVGGGCVHARVYACIAFAIRKKMYFNMINQKKDLVFH